MNSRKYKVSFLDALLICLDITIFFIPITKMPKTWYHSLKKKINKFIPLSYPYYIIRFSLAETIYVRNSSVHPTSNANYYYAGKETCFPNKRVRKLKYMINLPLSLSVQSVLHSRFNLIEDIF